MLMFTLATSCLTTFNLPWFVDLTFQFLCSIVSYSIELYFHHQSHPQLDIVFALAPSLLSGVISPLISSSILGTYRPGGFIFQCHIFLPFQAVHGVLKATILKWFAIPFSNGPRKREKEMATHSCTLAWKSPWTEEPCSLRSRGSQLLFNGLRFVRTLHHDPFVLGGPTQHDS